MRKLHCFFCGAAMACASLSPSTVHAVGDASFSAQMMQLNKETTSAIQSMTTAANTTANYLLMVKQFQVMLKNPKFAPQLIAAAAGKILPDDIAKDLKDTAKAVGAANNVYKDLEKKKKALDDVAKGYKGLADFGKSAQQNAKARKMTTEQYIDAMTKDDASVKQLAEFLDAAKAKIDKLDTVIKECANSDALTDTNTGSKSVAVITVCQDTARASQDKANVDARLALGSAQLIELRKAKEDAVQARVDNQDTKNTNDQAAAAMHALGGRR